MGREGFQRHRTARSSVLVEYEPVGTHLDPIQAHFAKRVFEISDLIVQKALKIDENGLELGRREAPRAHIRRGRSHGLSDASGSPPDPI